MACSSYDRTCYIVIKKLIIRVETRAYFQGCLDGVSNNKDIRKKYA